MSYTTTTGHCPECARHGFESESMKDHPLDDYQRLQADHERLQAGYQRLQAECEKLRKDAERIEWLEEQTKKSYTGISFDYHRHVEDGYVVDHGYRFMRRHFASGFKDSLRKAIDAAMQGDNP